MLSFLYMQPRNEWLIPGAIVVAGALLAVAIFYIRDGYVFGLPQGDPTAMRPISPDEHLIGNPEAPVQIVVYADIDSQYAKEYMRTLAQLMAEYGASGKVALVYRHLPLVAQNPNSGLHAEAAECAASVGSPTAFWRFIDLLQTNAPDEEEFDPDNYPAIVAQLGIDQTAFDTCLAQDRHAQKVQDDLRNGIEAGATASPYTLLRVGDKPVTPITGAIPYETLKQYIESV